MPEDLEQRPGLQRITARGPVTFVHESPRRRPRQPGLQVDAEWSGDFRGGAARIASWSPATAQVHLTPEHRPHRRTKSDPNAVPHTPPTVHDRAAEAVTDTRTDPEAPSAPESAEGEAPQAPSWPAHRPAPAGYLYEFGTGRLLPITATTHPPTPGRRRAYIWMD